jgi:uncharacterized membrane protein YphA (DoxX/SURF4 family)
MVGIVAGILLGLAFVWAGIAKLLDGPAWPKQAADMGVSRPIALFVPYVEIVIGVLTASRLFSPWPAVAALALLVAFTAVILLRLADGSRPPCACFGSRSKRPLGAIHVVRNIALIGVALVAILA